MWECESSGRVRLAADGVEREEADWRRRGECSVARSVDGLVTSPSRAVHALSYSSRPELKAGD